MARGSPPSGCSSSGARLADLAAANDRNRSDAAAGREVDAFHATLAGLCAVLVGIGLARFAYTPLIPALIDAQWFTAAQAAYLGAANLAGYLAGALLGAADGARPVPRPSCCAR